MRTPRPRGQTVWGRIGHAAVLLLVAAVAGSTLATSAAHAAAPVTRPLTIAVIATGPATPPTDEEIAQMVEVARTTWLSYSSGALTFVLGSIVRVERLGMPCRVPVVSEVGRAIGFQPKRDGHLIGLMVGEPCLAAGQATQHGRHVWVDCAGGLEYPGTTLAHQLGHNLGLIHTSTENCGAALETLCAAAVQQRCDPLGNWYGVPAGASVRLGKVLLTVASLDGVATVEVDGRTGPAVTVDAPVPRTAAVSVPAASPVSVFGLSSGLTYRAVLMQDAGAGFAPVAVSGAFATSADTSTAPAISVVPGEGSVTVSWTGGSAGVVQVRYCWTCGNETLSYWVTPWISTIETIPMDGPDGTIWLDLVSPSGDRYSVVAHRWGKGCKG